VILTVPLDAILTALLGAIFYSAARKHIPEGAPLLKSPYYWWGQCYNLVIGVGIAVTAYTINPDWMWMYWVDTDRLPFGFEVYVFCMYPAMFTLGFFLAEQLEKIREGLCIKLVCFLAVFLAGFILLCFDRLWNVGTVKNWESGTTIPIIGGDPLAVTPLAWALITVLVTATGVGSWLLVKFYRGRVG